MFKGGGIQNNYNKINTLLNCKKLKSLRKKGFLTGFLLLVGAVVLFVGIYWEKGLLFATHAVIDKNKELRFTKNVICKR